MFLFFFKSNYGFCCFFVPKIWKMIICTHLYTLTIYWIFSHVIFLDGGSNVLSIRPIRVHRRWFLALGIVCLYFLSFLRRNIRDPIGRYVSPWRIWLVDCFPTSMVRKFCLALQVKNRAKFFFEFFCCFGPIFVRFWSSKKQCLSKAVYFNISTGNFWPNYPFKHLPSYNIH